MAERKRYGVTAVMIVAKVPGAQGGEVYLRRGRVLPDSVTRAEVKRLLDLDLIEEVESYEDIAEQLELQRLEAEAQAEAAFDERVQAAAQKIVAEEIAPEFEKRVEAKAEELIAARTETPPAVTTPAVTTPPATTSTASKTSTTKTAAK
ncbi:hypothetical protein C5E11_03900 [Clavibacter michiganensis]|nr:hypothetical protein [Clavibacter michiganensis]PPF64545.1 hypothetical protein C5E11_03900 [Clavibacter michiganensis]